MILSIEHQAFVFLVSIIIGLISGVIFDFFRFIRKIIPHNNFATYMEDLFFWLIIIFISYVTLLHISNGEIRFYFFIGAFIGFGFYLLLFSQYLLNFLMYIYDFFYKTLVLLFKPMGILGKKCYKPTKTMLKKGKKSIYKTKVLLKKNLFYGKIKTRRLKSNIKMLIKKI